MMYSPDAMHAATQDIVERLAARAEPLCRELLPGGRKMAGEWRAGSLGGEPGQSLGVRLIGAKAALWSDFATGESGDALGLIKAALDLDSTGALAWARAWLGEGPGTSPRPQYRERAPRASESVLGHIPETGRPVEPDNPNLEAALKIWRAAGPIAGSPAEAYLRGRGIACPLPPSLRFHPSLRHGPSGQDLPALVAAVQREPSSSTAAADPGARAPIVAVHRTFLEIGDDDGAVTKAAVEPNKMLLGSARSGAVRLAQATSTIALTEGIETGLSIASACPDLAVWSALSTSGLRNVVLPRIAQTVILAADGDSAGRAASQAAAARFLAEGRQVKVVRLAERQDLNDVLQAG